MKTALLTLAAFAGLVAMSGSAEAAPHGSQSYRQSSPAVTQLAGNGYGHSHSSHHGHGGYDRGHGYDRSHYPSQHHNHGYHNHHNHGGYYRSYNSGYGYPGSGIGVSGRNFSFYYGF